MLIKICTLAPETTCHNEHGQGENGADDGATHVSGFSVLVTDGELVRGQYSLVKHLFDGYVEE